MSYYKQEEKMEKFDYKKEYKDLYLPKTSPSLIDVPKMKFILVEGKGNPNMENGEYQKAIELLYGLSFTIKMSKMGKNPIDGYFEYVVPPLEGFWWNHVGARGTVPKRKFPMDFHDKTTRICNTRRI